MSGIRALLAVKGSHGEATPWMQLIYKDLDALRRFHAEKLMEMPSPDIALQPWLDLIQKYPGAWGALVKTCNTAANDPPAERPLSRSGKAACRAVTMSTL